MTIRDMKASFDCIQQMPLHPTHRDDGTLDLIVTKVEQEVFDIAIDPLDISSDNNIVSGTYHCIINIQLCWSVNAGAGANLLRMNFDQHSSTLSCVTTTVVQKRKSTSTCTIMFYRVWQICLHR